MSLNQWTVARTPSCTSQVMKTVITDLHISSGRSVTTPLQDMTLCRWAGMREVGLKPLLSLYVPTSTRKGARVTINVLHAMSDSDRSISAADMVLGERSADTQPCALHLVLVQVCAERCVLWGHRCRLQREHAAADPGILPGGGRIAERQVGETEAHLLHTAWSRFTSGRTLRVATHTCRGCTGMPGSRHLRDLVLTH